MVLPHYFLFYYFFILATLQDLVESLAERPEAQLKKPSLRTEEKTLYYSAPASLEEATRGNLVKKLGDLLVDGEELAVSDMRRMLIKFLLFEIQLCDSHRSRVPDVNVLILCAQVKPAL